MIRIKRGKRRRKRKERLGVVDALGRRLESLVVGSDNYDHLSVYGEFWKQSQKNICDSNSRVCCLCFGRATAAHHMMYIDILWELLTGNVLAIRDRERAFLHAVGLCDECHHRIHKGELSHTWQTTPYKRWLNHNSFRMRWRLRVGWLLSWAVTIPLRFWRRRLVPTILLHMEINHSVRKPIKPPKRRRTTAEIEAEILRLKRK